MIEIERAVFFKSKSLKREVKYDVILPKNKTKAYTMVLMNDGQDYDQLCIEQIIKNRSLPTQSSFIYVGIHTNENRMKEYGTSDRPDYKKRGAKAGLYKDFVVNEFVPFLRSKYNVNEKMIFCGFSLGGLSAFDIAWEHPHIFAKVGVFSGSFWWRDKSYIDTENDDVNRIMHAKLRNSSYKEGLKFWLQCGTNDEKADRNKNGIIDSIDDTLDLIVELKNLGYTDNDIKYEEIVGGEHNFNTWRYAFPIFLSWALDGV